MTDAPHRDDELLCRWLTGETTETEERELDRAALASPALAAELRAHRRAIAEVRALPRELAPERDLWPEIARRLPPPRRRFPFAIVAGLAAAAALVVAVRVAEAPREAPLAYAAGAGAPAAPAVELAAYAETGRALAATRDELRRAVAARLDALPPETRRMVFENLETIDRAIADIEAALVRLPADRELARTYISYREREIALLRQANRLAARL